MDITLLASGLFLLVAIAFLLIFLIRGINKKSFKADDGSLFSKQSDLDAYQNLYFKTKPIFSDDREKGSSQEILGFDVIFLNKLTNDGFKELKDVVKYRKDFQALSDLINT